MCVCVCVCVCVWMYVCTVCMYACISISTDFFGPANDIQYLINEQFRENSAAMKSKMIKCSHEAFDSISTHFSVFSAINNN